MPPFSEEWGLSDGYSSSQYPRCALAIPSAARRVVSAGYRDKVPRLSLPPGRVSRTPPRAGLDRVAAGREGARRYRERVGEHAGSRKQRLQGRERHDSADHGSDSTEGPQGPIFIDATPRIVPIDAVRRLTAAHSDRNCARFVHYLAARRNASISARNFFLFLGEIMMQHLAP